MMKAWDGWRSHKTAYLMLHRDPWGRIGINSKHFVRIHFPARACHTIYFHLTYPKLVHGKLFLSKDVPKDAALILHTIQVR